MHFQWYPGHMAKAMRMMQENIKLIDLVIELLDARLPGSSKNPDIDQLAQNKTRLILLNKADMADPQITELWEDYYKDKGFFVCRINSRSGKGMKEVRKLIDRACRDKKERDRKRGILNRPVRAMVAGIPNVGKSTFINSFTGKACTKTGNRPGVTKGKQWIRINKNVELLDTPGILWPKFEDQSVGLKLAFTGSIKDELLNNRDLACGLAEFLIADYPGLLADRYGVKEDADPFEILCQIADRRGCLLKGGGLDTTKAGSLLLEDFRLQRLGTISLEKPEEALGTS